MPLIYPILFTSICLLLIAGLITMAFVIPLQVKEAGVKNGLAKLRKQMLVKGLLTLIVIATAIFALTARFFITDYFWVRYTVAVVVLVFSIGTLGKAAIDYLVYHQQYTPENKKLHERIQQLENQDKKNYK